MRNSLLLVAFAMLVVIAAPARAQFCPGAAPWVFDDVPDTDPFCGYITWAALNGITLGCNIIDANHRLYCPGAPVLRSQMAAFVNRLGNIRVEAVGTGPGLTGGPITSAGTIGLASTQLLPTAACANNQIPRWNGSAWACGNDANSGGTVTSVGSGTGLAGGPVTSVGTLSIATAFQLPQSCLNGQVAKSSGAGTWTCASDANSGGTVTSVGTGVGLTGGPITASGTINLASTQLLPTVACATGWIPSWNGSAWACSDPSAFGGNVDLADSTSPSVGNVTKGGTRFIHNYGSDNTFVGKAAGNFTMTGNYNTASGANALNSNTTGTFSTASGRLALGSNTTGGSNAASGANALYSNTSGVNNTASGVNALYSNTTGYSNIASGAYALFSNTTGYDNTASGGHALTSNMTGDSNTASGESALYSNTTGYSNTASGAHAMLSNTIGNYNTASGANALLSNTTGYYNTAGGANALLSNTTGYYNTAGGANALVSNSTGYSNTAGGGHALDSNTTGAGNIALGYQAGHLLTTGDNNIAIGHAGVAGEGATIRIGNSPTHTRTFVAGIRGVTTGINNGVNVVIDGSGQLGTISSSREVKDDIADMDAASAALTQLRPVVYHYKSDRDPAGRRLQYGLIAEEVAEVYPGLVADDANGKPETVMYQYLAPMLLNEYQKQQRTIETQAREIAELRRAVEVLMARTSPEGRIALQ